MILSRLLISISWYFFICSTIILRRLFYLWCFFFSFSTFGTLLSYLPYATINGAGDLAFGMGFSSYSESESLPLRLRRFLRSNAAISASRALRAEASELILLLILL